MALKLLGCARWSRHWSGGGADGRSLPAGRPIDTIQTKRRLKGEQAEPYALYSKLMRYAERAEETCHSLSWNVVSKVATHRPELLECPLVNDAYQMCRKFLVFEQYFPLIEIDFSQNISMGEIWTLTKTTRQQIAFYETQERRETVAEFLATCLSLLLEDVQIPLYTTGEEEMLHVSLDSLHQRLPAAIEGIIGYTFSDPSYESLFNRLGKVLGRNLCIASGIDPELRGESHKQPLMPSAPNNKYQHVLVDTYLAYTPFADSCTRSTLHDSRKRPL